MDISKTTVIIPTKNEEQNIISFLDSLPANIQLIVVDCSTDRTRELIQIRRPENTEVIFDESTIPAARQLGANTTAADWLIYSDADMNYDKAYFKELDEQTVSSKVGAIMGSKLSLKDYRWYYKMYSFSMRFFAWFGLPVGSGSNMIIRKAALEQIGGFDLSLTHSEDSDVLWRIRKAGWKVIFNGKLKVYETDHRRLQQGVLKKFIHGSLRAFFLITGINKKKVQQSDWGYWKNEKK